MTAIQQWWFGGGKRVGGAVPPGDYELLEDGTYELREDGTFELRDNEALYDFIITTAPLVWWKMDEVTGSTGADAGTLALDLTYDPPQVTLGLPSLVGPGFSMKPHSTGAYNGAIASAATELDFQGSDFTISAVIRKDGTAINGFDPVTSDNWGTIVIQAKTNVSWTKWALLVNDDHQFILSLNDTDDVSGLHQFKTDPIIDDGEVYFLVARRTGNTIDMFVNNVLQNTFTFTTDLWHGATVPVGVGSTPHGTGLNMGGYIFNGGIDNVLLWNRAISDADLTSIAHQIGVI